MNVWCVERDLNDCDTPSWVIITEAVCDSENRAAQVIFEATGVWPARDERGVLSVTTRDHEEWSVVECEVLTSGVAMEVPA